MSPEAKIIPSVSVTYARNGSSTKSNALGMRPMQERAYEKRGEQFLLLKSPPASGKSRALMFIALDKITHQGLKQAIIVVPERSIGASFNDEPLSKYGFWADWHVKPKWNLCNAPGGENGSKVKAVGAFLESDDKVLVCTHATFRFAVDEYGVEAFDDRLIAIDEFHHVSANPDNKLGAHLGQFIARDRVHIVAMTGSYFRGDAEAVLSPQDEEKFDTVTYTYYEQLNGYEHLKQLDMGYYFYSGSYIEDIPKVLDLSEKTIIHIPNVNSRESTKRGKTTEVSEIMGALGSWEGKDPETGFDRVRVANGDVLKIADLVDDGPERHAKVLASLKDPAQKHSGASLAGSSEIVRMVGGMFRASRRQPHSWEMEDADSFTAQAWTGASWRTAPAASPGVEEDACAAPSRDGARRSRRAKEPEWTSASC